MFTKRHLAFFCWLADNFFAICRQKMPFIEQVLVFLFAGPQYPSSQNKDTAASRRAVAWRWLTTSVQGPAWAEEGIAREVYVETTEFDHRGFDRSPSAHSRPDADGFRVVRNMRD